MAIPRGHSRFSHGGRTRVARGGHIVPRRRRGAGLGYGDWPTYPVFNRPMGPDETARLMQAAEVIAEEARRIASTFSVRIPRATQVRGGVTGVYIITYAAIAPNAYPFDSAAFHPLFGHDPWYQQPYKPYMDMAVAAKLDDAAEAFAEVIDDWAHELGFV